ncbi:MAG TPA: DUF6438 domain-containing protein [Saprospiraceae bacterium]|nr:DUF6438 domain-containing protein [Saprospiraceae bacterium]
MKKLLFLLVSVIFLASCSSVKIIGDERGQVAAIEKSPCFGKCPVYAMRLFKDGKVIYEGRANTKKLGVYQKMLTKKELGAIVKAFDNAKFFTFNDSYSSELADLPSTLLYFSDGKINKSVVGKENRPAPIMQLQYMLEKIADSDGWLMLKGPDVQEEIEERVVEEEVTIFSEIIIEPTPGSLPRFLQDYQEKSVSLTDRITEDGRLWLIKYNTSAYKPEEMLQMIKSDSRIISAEFNKKLQNR